MKDHITHVTGWDRAERAVLPHEGSLSHVPAISAGAWNRGDFDRINDEILQPTAGDLPTVVRAARRGLERHLGAEHDLSDEQLAAPPGGTGLELGAEPPAWSLVALLAEQLGSALSRAPWLHQDSG